jgi:sec-independent protein translocase protein TatA
MIIIVFMIIIVIVVFGTGKLPGIGSGLGKAIRGFMNAVSGPSEIDVTPKKDHSDDKKH